MSGINWRVWLGAYAPLFLWIGVIIFLSSPEGSFAQTSRIIGPLLNFFFPDMPEATRLLVHSYVRKTAHFTEYAVLAYLAIRAFSGSASYLLRKSRYILALILVTVVASLDEFNQSFESARTGSYMDVLLDLSGGLVMVAVFWVLNRRKTDAQARK